LVADITFLRFSPLRYASRAPPDEGARRPINRAVARTFGWRNLSVIAVVPRDNVKALRNGDKLQIVDAFAAIQRYAYKVCGAVAAPQLWRDTPCCSASPRLAEASEGG
jgi:hypothetical protein